MNNIPLFQQTILITRSFQQASPLQKRLESLGANTICIPTIEISSPPHWQAFDTAFTNYQEFDWILFTSLNAVQKTQERIHALGGSMQQLSRLNIGAIGNQTQNALLQLQLNVTLVPQEYSSTGMCQALQQLQIQGKHFWIPSALVRNPELPDYIRTAGGIASCTPVYQTILPQQNIGLLQETMMQKNIDWIVFSSSSTVHHFFTMLGEPLLSYPKIASLGTRTTATLLEYGFSPSFTAYPHNIDGLLQGIVQYGEQ